MQPEEQTMELAPPMRAAGFFTGFGLGYPYFVVVSKFAMFFGGDHAALVSQALSLFALAVCAVANSLFGVLTSRAMWTGVAILVLVASCLALVCMILFDFVEWRRKQNKRNADLEEAVALVLLPNGGAEEHPAPADPQKPSESQQPHMKKRGFWRNGRGNPTTGKTEGFDKRPDSSPDGSNYFWACLTTFIVLAVTIGLFISYYWSQNPDMFMPFVLT